MLVSSSEEELSLLPPLTHNPANENLSNYTCCVFCKYISQDEWPQFSYNTQAIPLESMTHKMFEIV